MTCPQEHDLASDHIVGRSRAIQALRATISNIAKSGLPVLVRGPSGAGKELVARALHAESESAGSLIAVNIAAVNEPFFENAMFGHVRGAFSGAMSDTHGYLDEAHHGTLFLDEIGAVNPRVQAKLLRLVETRVYRPLGAKTDRRSDFRLVCASNEDLDASIARGDFREDLAYRLSAAVLRVPALDERREDIPLLIEHCLAQRGRQMRFSPSAVAFLGNQQWPGNVRQLRNFVMLADSVVTCRSITECDIAELLTNERLGSFAQNEPCHSACRRIGDGSLSTTVLRRRVISSLLDARGDTVAAAAHIGLSRSSFYRLMRKLGVETPRRRRIQNLAD